MRNAILHVCWITALAVIPVFAENESLVVYDEVPGAVASEHYRFALKSVGSDGPWQPAFAFITRCKPAGENNNYFAHLNGWSNTYINFEMRDPVVVRITRADHQPIRKAAAHPRRKVRSCEVRNGKVFVIIDQPGQVAIDIDGQMDDHDTGKGYQGPPIHTLTLFANPVIKDRPNPAGTGVLTVRPGEKPPREGVWKTLYFLPGVHDIGVGFPVHANKHYYIPGDAIVHGTLANHAWNNGHNIRIYGYGTLSGEHIAHPEFARPRPKHDREHNPIHIAGAENISVEGITLADSAHHSLMLVSGYKKNRPNTIRWTKIFTWRGNGDGINPFGNTLIEDCFIRTQDDATYVNGRGIRRVTYWNDFNGSTFVLSAMPNRPLVVEDCDIIYARAGWNKWSGGRVFNMRGEGAGDCGKGVVFRNIRVEDPRPTLQHFMIAMQGVEPYSDPAERQRGPGHLSGVLFQDIEIAAPSVLGEPDVLWGSPNAKIRNLTFDNVTIGGTPIDSLDHFKHNAHVKDLEFRVKPARK